MNSILTIFILKVPSTTRQAKDGKPYAVLPACAAAPSSKMASRMYRF